MPSNQRTYRTLYDVHYQKHRTLVRPKVMHATLKDSSTGASNTSRAQAAKNVLVIGDVHGCLSELQQLHQKAITTLNNGAEFRAVILVGDLVNKGPSSAEVVRYVRNKSVDETHWYSIRGNHDDAALKAALGDEGRRSKDRYRWAEQLSDEDVQWLSELPYTIRIPREYLVRDEADTCNKDSEDYDTVIVHAGFIPEVSLEDQDIGTMVTVREVACGCSGDRKPWAQAWSDTDSTARRPYRVIFGHDARRGLQRPGGDMAIGLDTGAVYGGQLTGIVLPGREHVSVVSKEYCPVGRKTKRQAKEYL